MNHLQRMQMNRLRAVSFNNLDGPQLADNLEDAPECWTSFIIGRFGHLELVELRDMHEGYLNVDTIYALVPKDGIEEFLGITKDNNVDEWGYTNGVSYHGVIDEKDVKMLGGPVPSGQFLVRLWWD